MHRLCAVNVCVGGVLLVDVKRDDSIVILLMALHVYCMCAMVILFPMS